MISRGLLLSGLSLISFAASGQTETPADLDISAADIVGRLDLDVPDSPAFAILGIAPQNVINPDTPAELATAFILGNDNAGNMQEGIAVEFRPYLMAKGSDITLGDYYHNQWLSRTAISFSQSKGTDDEDRASRQAIGFSFTPIDKRDPLTSRRVESCLKTGTDKANKIQLPLENALDAAISTPVLDQVAVDEAREALNNFITIERKNILEETTDSCLNTHEKDTINAEQLQLGMAYHDSEVESIDESGGAFWISYARPLMAGSLIAHARYSDNLVMADAANVGQYKVMDQSVLGIRYRQGDDKRAVLFEASYVDEEDNTGNLDDSYSSALVGVEFRLFESLWIQFAFGDTFGSNQEKDLALSGQFRWAASKSRLWDSDD